MSTLHELKIWTDNFEAVAEGRNRVQLRRNDRDFQNGDRLLLKEWDPGKREFTGRAVGVRVNYMVRRGTPSDRRIPTMGLSPGYVIMSVEVDPTILDQQ